jgi:hypothetical protein
MLVKLALPQFPPSAEVDALRIAVAEALSAPPWPCWLLGGWYEVRGPGMPHALHRTFDDAVRSINGRRLQWGDGTAYEILQRGPADESFVPVARWIAWRGRPGYVVTVPAAMPVREGRSP